MLNCIFMISIRCKDAVLLGGIREKKWNPVWCLSVTFECKLLLSPSREIRVMARLSAITQHCWIYARACRSPVVTAMSPTRSLVWMSTTPTRFKSGLPQKSVLHSMQPMCTFLSTVKVAYNPNTLAYTHTHTHTRLIGSCAMKLLLPWKRWNAHLRCYIFLMYTLYDKSLSRKLDTSSIKLDFWVNAFGHWSNSEAMNFVRWWHFVKVPCRYAFRSKAFFFPDKIFCDFLPYWLRQSLFILGTFW